MTRLVVRVYNYVCNAPGCEAVTDDLTGCGEENSARAAWAEASAEGWNVGRRENDHYCPEHSLCD